MTSECLISQNENSCRLPEMDKTLAVLLTKLSMIGNIVV